MVETFLQGGFAEFAEGELVVIVADAFEDCIEVVLVEDELHEALGLDGELAFDLFFGLCLAVVLGLHFRVILIIFFIILFDERILLRLWFFTSVLPTVA